MLHTDLPHGDPKGLIVSDKAPLRAMVLLLVGQVSNGRRRSIRIGQE